MILLKIYNKISKERKEDFVFGLVFGLVFSLVFGLGSGLVYGLVYGLVMILYNFSEALPFIDGIIPILILIGLIFLLTELLFLLMPKEKLKKEVNLFWHTAKRKGECLFEVLLGLSAIAQVYIFIRETSHYFNKELLDFTLILIGYIGLGLSGIIVIGLLFYLWIKLNSVKYQ